MRKRHTAAFKAQIVRELLREEQSVSQLAAAHGLHPNQLYRWRDQALDGLPGLFADTSAQQLAALQAAQEAERQQLYAEIGRLSTELGWLKKKLDTCLSRDARLALLDRPPQEVPLTRQAALLGLSRASLYYQPVPPSSEELALKHRIDEIYTAHPFYGVRRITAQLQADGQCVNHKAVARHMREMGLAAIYPGPNLSRRAHQAGIYPYLLRNVTADRPNHVWGVDITYIRWVGGWLYLVAVLDWYSRYIVSWALDQTLALPFVLTAMMTALAGAQPVICNSDQGSHFTSPAYIALLTAAGVHISMDGKGRALDNVFTERLWRSIKYEEVYLHEYRTPRDAREGLSRYIRFYNEERLHQALDYRPPASVYHAVGDSPTAEGFPRP